MIWKRKVLSGAILLGGALLLLPTPSVSQSRRPNTKVDEFEPRGPRERNAPAPAALPAAASKGVTEVFFCETFKSDCRSSNSSFTVTRIRDLYVFVTWPNVSGDLVQSLEFYLPDGSLYMKRDTPFSTRVGQAGARSVVGAKPVASQFLTTSRGAPTVVTPLAVKGTYISQRNLLGTWTVRVLLGGKPVATGQFTLKAAN